MNWLATLLTCCSAWLIAGLMAGPVLGRRLKSVSDTTPEPQ